MKLDSNNGNSNVKEPVISVMSTMPVTGARTMDHRCQQVDTFLTAVAFRRVRVLVREVDICGQHITEGAHRLDLRLHRQQYPPHIGVVNDRDPVAAALPHRPALDPFLGMIACRLIGPLGDPQTL